MQRILEQSNKYPAKDVLLHRYHYNFAKQKAHKRYIPSSFVDFTNRRLIFFDESSRNWYQAPQIGQKGVISLAHISYPLECDRWFPKDHRCLCDLVAILPDYGVWTPICQSNPTLFLIFPTFTPVQNASRRHSEKVAFAVNDKLRRSRIINANFQNKIPKRDDRVGILYIEDKDQEDGVF